MRFHAASGHPRSLAQVGGGVITIGSDMLGQLSTGGHHHPQLPTPASPPQQSRNKVTKEEEEASTARCWPPPRPPAAQIIPTILPDSPWFYPCPPGYRGSALLIGVLFGFWRVGIRSCIHTREGIRLPGSFFSCQEICGRETKLRQIRAIIEISSNPPQLNPLKISSA